MTELERATQAYCQEHNDDCFEAIGDECPFIGKAFKAGAEWQREQFENERLKHCDELTAEQAQIESDFVVQHLEKYNRTPTFIDAIEYGKRLMIDKAVEWLKDNASNYIINTTPSYCFLHCRYDDGYFYTDFENGNTADSYDIIPATKEQRDTLMKAMADAGYTFDFEKKELKKIEQNPTWSEEDENYLQSAENACEYQYGKNTSTILWLKSLKDRVKGKEGKK